MGNLAPGEGDVDIYPGPGFFEVEAQGVHVESGQRQPVREHLVACGEDPFVRDGRGRQHHALSFAQQQAAM